MTSRAGGFTRWRLRASSHPRETTVAAVLVVAVVVGGVLWLRDRSSASAGAPAPATTRLVAATLGTVRESVSTTGTVEPADQDDLNFTASGSVTSVRVAQGDRVTKGERLATIDSASLRASLAQARASLANAQAKVAGDQATTTTTTTQLGADEASVTAARGQVSSARAALAGATMTAPITGVVAAVNLTVGQQVSGSSGSGGSNAGGSASGGSGGSGSGGSGSGGSGSGATSSTTSTSTAQLQVIGTSSWIASATVDATELGQVHKGEQAQLTVTGLTSLVFGTVSSVGVLPSSSSTTTAYPVTIAVTGNPAGLHSGASAGIAVIYKQVTNVLTVPSLAVTSNGTASSVLVSSGARQVRTPVTVGVSSGGTTQITAGLKSGQQVVVAVPVRTGGGTTGTGTGTGAGFGRTGAGTGAGTGRGGFGGAGGGAFGGAGGN